MSKYKDQMIDTYTHLIESDQDTYYEIRDYLRETLSNGEDDEDTIAEHIQITWGDTWSYFTEDLMEDVHDLLEYEAANSLPTEP